MQVGDYVRYKNGEIEKIHSFAEQDNPLFNILINARYHNTNEIKKFGEPIDLIEVGDYVNGKEITSIRPADICGDEKLDYQHIYYGRLEEIYRDEIKSIVTKEQFESMKYEVK